MVSRRVLFVAIAVAIAAVVFAVLLPQPTQLPTRALPTKPDGTPAAPSTKRALKPVRLQLNWVPEPEFGGIYAAQQEGFFEAEGLAVQIIKGASGTPAAQMTAGGQAEFGVVSGDQVLSLRERGGELVALYAIFHTSPMGLMVRADAPYQSLEQLWQSDATIAMEAGLPFVRFLNERYPGSKVRIVPSGSGLAAFERGAVQAQQCFISAEPVQMELRKIPVRVFSLAASGYDPYTVTIATSAAFFASDRDSCAAFVRALRAGWASYLREPAKYNPAIHALNPAMSLEAMEIAAAKQHDLIESTPLGAMTAERWRTLAEQMQRLGALKAMPARIDDCFWNAPTVQ